MELTNWRQLSDRGPDLIPCLDFSGARAEAGFAELAAGVPVDACFLHIGQAGAGPLAACVDRWADELLATGRPVRAVLGYCAGTALATRLADAIAATGPPPMVVLLDAVPTTADTLTSQFTLALESNARHLTADELADAQRLADQLVGTCPDDLPRRLGSVGTAVPGGTITIRPEPVHARAVPGEGAVQYRGPGVMLGYATRRADLCRGAEVDVLDTGDLGYLRKGYLYLTGRTKRIVKVLGVRTSLDDLERMVERPGHPAAVICGTDDVVHLVGAGDAAVHEQQRQQLVESLGVPSRHVVFRPVDHLPRTPGGKVDYRALATLMDSQERVG